MAVLVQANIDDAHLDALRKRLNVVPDTEDKAELVRAIDERVTEALAVKSIVTSRLETLSRPLDGLSDSVSKKKEELSVNQRKVEYCYDHVRRASIGDAVETGASLGMKLFAAVMLGGVGLSDGVGLSPGILKFCFGVVAAAGVLPPLVTAVENVYYRVAGHFADKRVADSENALAIARSSRNSLIDNINAFKARYADFISFDADGYKQRVIGSVARNILDHHNSGVLISAFNRSTHAIPEWVDEFVMENSKRHAHDCRAPRA